MRAWASIARDGARHLETDSSAIELLRHREHGLKRLKARLLHDAPLERWSC
ncbi:DUF6361 family protein [Sinorhizobium medicae]|uniref:DUF6361 family protein n=1 Tax=Sinorhizobium medicae TaxID=110321 RepID=UPI00299DD280|nr:DUF6361 family protein [Sinorhizobium medicae]